jgi:hypothetical protein
VQALRLMAHKASTGSPCARCRLRGSRQPTLGSSVLAVAPNDAGGEIRLVQLAAALNHQQPSHLRVGRSQPATEPGRRHTSADTPSLTQGSAPQAIDRLQASLPSPINRAHVGGINLRPTATLPFFLTQPQKRAEETGKLARRNALARLQLGDRTNDQRIQRNVQPRIHALRRLNLRLLPLQPASLRTAKTGLPSTLRIERSPTTQPCYLLLV